MTYELRVMTMNDYDDVFALWSSMEGLSISEDDSRELVRRAVSELAKQGIQKCNLYVLDVNPPARRFWEHMGWRRLEDDYRTFQVTTDA